MKEKTAEKLHKKFKDAGIETWIVNRCALMIGGKIITSANKASAMLARILAPR